MIGAAFALTDSKVKETLDGQVVFFAVPAEEYGEIEFKNPADKMRERSAMAVENAS